MPFFESRLAPLRPVFIHHVEEHPSARCRSKSYSGYIPYKYFYEDEADDVMEAEPQRKATGTTTGCRMNDSTSGSKKEVSNGLRKISLLEALSVGVSGDASESQEPCEKRASTSSMPMPPPSAYAARQLSIADASRHAAPQLSPLKQPASSPPAFVPSAKGKKAETLAAGKVETKATGAVAEAAANSPPSSAPVALPSEVCHSKPPSPVKRLLKRYVASPGPSAESYTQKVSQERDLDMGSKTLRNFGSRDLPPHVTTVMIKNLPKTIGQQELLRELNESGFADSYDFCYVPRDFASAEGQGFAFVNFYCNLEAKRFSTAWNQKERFDTLLAIRKADVQGFAANRKKWAGARMLRVRNPAFRPFVREEADSSESTPQLSLSRSSN